MSDKYIIYVEGPTESLYEFDKTISNPIKKKVSNFCWKKLGYKKENIEKHLNQLDTSNERIITTEWKNKVQNSLLSS
jgi:hypothetical protein